MKIGLVGLGKMGYNLALNMKNNGYEPIPYDITTNLVEKIINDEGIEAKFTIEDMIDKLDLKKVIWLMIPAGKPVDDMINKLKKILKKGDVIIDGGNSHYKDTLRRYAELKEKGIHLVDVGTSGGVDGAKNGVCAMVGADKDVFEYIKPLIEDISVDNGYIHTGEVGSGHYVKMVHNGIEYGMMQAIGEGFDILSNSRFELNNKEISRVWNNGSVIRGWLMELTENMFRKDNSLDDIKGVVHSSGEGLWTVQEALELKVSAPVITESLFVRFRSEKKDTFSGKVVAGLRNEFGGHAVEKD